MYNAQETDNIFCNRPQSTVPPIPRNEIPLSNEIPRNNVNPIKSAEAENDADNLLGDYDQYFAVHSP